MKISQLVAMLNKLQERYGDIETVIDYQDGKELIVGVEYRVETPYWDETIRDFKKEPVILII